VAAAGNDGVDNDTSSRKSYPAALDNDNLISVAASDQSDRMAFFSNYGAKTTHLAAPGVGIVSTVPGNSYKSADGTSMAAPHVAGAAALIWSRNPSMTYKQVKDILLQSVDVMPAFQGKTVTGGRLNVSKALRMVKRSN
jgi:thermitase